ncbi:hypothetical protein IU436_01255 [Nocardia farcinica]|nr:hypothetical protein [Nocardia farcinica]MBF6256686.1 hypothetical protein [Nocardia farcinica]MBF6417517.1 hypothetical protein [Nocardia farcinica]MBF6428977.1 hypothetical protein [Nocardia farcinica]MBF6440623.1 hypothetical protein [Nocardia farcinica]
MANLVSAIREGSATVQMSPEDFVYIDRDCEYFKATIRQIQLLAQRIADQSSWGLGEGNERLVSAGTIVARFRGKAMGAVDGNAVHEVMEQHYRIVEDIQEVHRIARERMMEADSSFAAEFNQLNETLPERPPEARSPEQALAALSSMPGLGPIFATVPTPTAPSLWPGVPMDGADK